jgi:hypothetical protein
VSTAQICRYSECPERFLDLLAKSNCPFADPVSFALGARYYRAYFATEYRGDVSFIVHDRDHVLAVVRGQAVGDVIFDNGVGASVFLAQDAQPSSIVAALDEAARLHGCSVINVSCAGTPEKFSEYLLHHRASPLVRFLAVADLTESEDALRRGVRRRFRSMVNWGTRELRMQLVTASSFDPEAFESFRQFHIRVAGRETRGVESWAIQAEMIRGDRGELLLSYLDGHGLVGGSLFLDTGVTTTYGVGVYDRDLFDKPLSHAPMFTAMLRAKQRGQRSFVIGDVPPAGRVTDKEFSIGQFKSGFSDTLLTTVDWTLSIAPAESADG